MKRKTYHKIAKEKYQKLSFDYRLEDLEPSSKTRLSELRKKFEDISFLVVIGG